MRSMRILTAGDGGLNGSFWAGFMVVEWALKKRLGFCGYLDNGRQMVIQMATQHQWDRYRDRCGDFMVIRSCFSRLSVMHMGI